MAGDREKGPDSGQTLWVAAGQYMGYGLTWALSVLLFLMGGWWLDGKLGTTPLLMISGAFLGAGAGFYSLYRHVIASAEGAAGADRAGKERRAKRDEEEGAPP